MELLLDVVLDAFLDTLKLLPLLFLTYLLMEYIEHRGSDKMEAAIHRSGRLGPLLGALLGLVPQCGLAGAAAGFFSSRIITPGTLLAIFLATSDEMLPLMIAAAAPAGTVFRLLAAKLIIGLSMGLLLDIFLANKRQFRKDQVCSMCEREHCGCDEHGLFHAALHHSLKIALFIFIISLALGLTLEMSGIEQLGGSLLSAPVWGPVLAGLVGLIPNCTPSVVLTTLYLENTLSAGSLLAGLLTNAGMGLLVLYRTNVSWKENLSFTALLYLIGVLFGILAAILGLVF